MIDFIDQLKQDMIDVFTSRTDSYKDTLVKKAYETLPKGKFPKATIEQLNDSEVLTRTTNQGEQTTLLSYQLVFYSRDTEEYDYTESAKFMADIVEQYLMNKYPLHRLGSKVVKPYISDSTVMTCTTRYECVYDKETNLIYKN